MAAGMVSSAVSDMYLVSSWSTTVTLSMLVSVKAVSTVMGANLPWPTPVYVPALNVPFSPPADALGAQPDSPNRAMFTPAIAAPATNPRRVMPCGLDAFVLVVFSFILISILSLVVSDAAEYAALAAFANLPQAQITG